MIYTPSFLAAAKPVFPRFDTRMELISQRKGYQAVFEARLTYL